MKIIISDYTFNAAAQTITFNDYASILLDNILLITNVEDNTVIYQFTSPTKGGSVSTNVLTLDYDTTSMSNTDALQIWYYDENAPKNVKITDGTDIADIFDLTNSNPLAVAIVDANGDQTTAFGGGVEYTEGDTDATITGKAMLWEDTADTLRPVSAAKPLPVNIVAGSSSGTEYTEDAASVANPVGGQLMTRRRDALSAETDTDGDVIALNATNKGELYVKQTDPVPVTDNGGSLTVDATDLDIRNLSFAQDKVDASGSTLGANSGVDIGDVTVNNGSGAGAVPIQDGGNSITVDGSVAVTGSVDTELPAAATLADDTANPTVPSVGTLPHWFDGSTWDRARGNSTDGLLVNLGTNNDVVVTGVVTANAGTDLNTSLLSLEATQVDVRTALQLIDDTVKTLGTDTYTEATTKGLAIGAVRRDADTSAVNTDNEVAPLLVNAIGALKVEVFSGETLPVSGTFFQATQPVSATDLDIRNLVAATDIVDLGGNALTSLQLIDDAVYTDDTSTHATGTSKGLGIMAVAAPTDTAVNANDIGMVAMTVNRELLVQVNTALPAGTNYIGKTRLTDGTTDTDVRDLTNSNALNVAIVDGSGDQITSFGGGTEYTEDAAAAANPVGKATILVRQDTPAALTTTDGDNVAQRATNFGAAFVQVLTSAGAFVDTFGGGQQYTEGDTDATITGTAMLMEGAGNTLLPVQGTVADGLLVNLGANNDVTVTGTVTANAGTNLNTSALNLEATQADVRTAVQLIDDTVATMGTDTYTEATSKGLNITAVRRDADTTLVGTTNEFGPLQMDANGRLKVEVFSGETLPVSGTVTVTATDLDIRNLVAATDIVDLGGNALTSLQLMDDSIFVAGTDTYTEATSKGQLLLAVRRDADTTLVGTTNEFGPLQMDANGALKVEIFDGGGTHTVDAPVGTPVNVQIGNATLTVGVIDETGASAVDAMAVGGGTAHDAVDSGNPIKIGSVAVSGSATPTSVASGDRTRHIANQHGIPYNMAGHPNLITREYDFGATAQTDVNLAAAAVAADERVYVTRLEVLCDNANTVAVSARVGFGTASVPAASSTGVSGMIASHPGIAAGSGIICGTGAGIIAVGGAGEEPRITTTAATNGNTHVIISYYLIDETP